MQKHKYGGGLSLLINTYKNQHLCCIHTKWTLSRSPHQIKPVFFPQKNNHYYNNKNPFRIFTKTNKNKSIWEFGNPNERRKTWRGWSTWERRSEEWSGKRLRSADSAVSECFGGILLINPIAASIFLSLSLYIRHKASAGKQQNKMRRRGAHPSRFDPIFPRGNHSLFLLFIGLKWRVLKIIGLYYFSLNNEGSIVN